MKYIGLDLGTKTLGVALSDKLGLVASFYKNISYTDEELLILEIDKIINSYVESSQTPSVDFVGQIYNNLVYNLNSHSLQ